MEPLEEARAFQEYIKRYGWGSNKDLARKIGRSPSFVSRRLRLLDLPDKTLQELFRRRNNPSLVEEILAVEDDELRQHFVHLSSELELSSKEVRRLNKSLAKGRELPQVGLGFPTGKLRDDRRRQALRNAIQRTVVALRVALHRLDEVFENVDDDEWVIKEVLMQQRLALHSQLDLVCNLTKRLEKLPAPKL